jgi:hypothetical protein
MMETRNMDRRQFLKLGLAAVGATCIGMPLAHANDKQALYSASDEGAVHQISRLDLVTGERQTWDIPFRAHDILPLPEQQQVIAFGRRPDKFCAVAHFDQPEVQLIDAAEQRHFYGHGCLNQQGDVLFTTENDYDAARGMIGIRDLKTHKILGEYETYGVGPHDIHLMPDGKTLVIANGGIETHPDYGRRKLNLKTMQPSLTYIDAETGQKVDDFRLADQQLSIRHLTVTEQGDVGVATQYQGNLYKKQPQTLVAWQVNGGELTTLSINRAAIKPLKGYMADLAFDSRQQLLAVTSPRGNQITFWDIAESRFLHALELPEPSGIVYQPEAGRFVVSSAKGGVYSVTTTRTNSLANPIHEYKSVMWDNHMLLV